MSDATNIVMMDSQEAATYRTNIKGWVSAKGHFYGDGPEAERIARYDGATHRKCEGCGAVIDVSYRCCGECLAKADHERWLKLPLIDWDGETPLCIFNDDTYFFSLDEVYVHADANDLKVSELDLVVCEPKYARPLDDSHFEDKLPKDGDMPAWLKDAVNTLNQTILAHKGEPLSWIGGKQRVVLPDEDESHAAAL